MRGTRRARMKSSEDIARELGITAQEIEARLGPEFARRFGGHIEETGGGTLFDEEAEEFLRLMLARGGAKAEAAATWEELSPVNGAAAPALAVAAAGATAPAAAPQGWAAPGRPVPQAPPAWSGIELPLTYQPEALALAVDQHRREIAAFLCQFDRAVDRLVEGFPQKAGPKGRKQAALGR